MISPKPLLTDLQKWVTKFENDLRQRSREVPELDASLKADWQKARDSKRTAEAYEVWRDGQLTQSAVGWVLGCVFVRFLEDNQLLDRPWIAGGGDRRLEAEHVRDAYFSENGTLSDRDYLQHVFTEVGKLPGMADLFDRRHNALWRAGISGDAAADFIAFWRKMDHDFTDAAWDTRFLGDLYQDLSEYAKDTFALLQTPEFVEEFILDRTLDPAIERFGYEPVRMIDPTCGSGHFLLGGFKRLLALWQRGHPEMNEREIVKRALEGIYGVDINPFAVAIARFRLLLEAWRACGIQRLRAAPDFRVNLAVGDSLLHGPVPGEITSPDSLKLRIEAANNTFAVELPDELTRILGGKYHAVVGNPPYITVKDKALNKAYRSIFRSCHRKYSLSAPFMERFFDLAVKGDSRAGELAGFVGQITSNSFMKREFGKKLIENFIPSWDLTHVIDTSGAFIPGHGTPTVILFGRNQNPVLPIIRAVMGIKGEPTTPDDAATGKVWTAILAQLDHPGSQSEFVSASDVVRESFHHHPWSIGGGGAAELKEQVDESGTSRLEDLVDTIGFGCVLGEDEIFTARLDINHLRMFPRQVRRTLVEGDIVRDWQIAFDSEALFPYDESIELRSDPWLLDRLWPVRSFLWSRKDFGQQSYRDAGRPYWEYHQIPIERNKAKFLITFAEVASHNHFVLDRGGKVFKQTAPVIKLPDEAPEARHQSLVGFLNSSLICFRMKQVAHQKQMTGGDGVRVESRAKVPYQFAGTQLLQIPIPPFFEEGPLSERLLKLSKAADAYSQRLLNLTPYRVVCASVTTGADLRQTWANCLADRADIRSKMILLQEQIDFTVYAMFGLVEDDLIGADIDDAAFSLEAGQRPFEILAGKSEEGFQVPSDIPAEWPEAVRRLWSQRMDFISASSDLKIVEDPHYKRRWIGRQGLFNHAARANELKDAMKLWMLERLESVFFEAEKLSADSACVVPDAVRSTFAAAREPRLCSTRQLADAISHDTDFMRVAGVYRERNDFDLPRLIQDLVEDESVPFLPFDRYKDSGLRKRVIWERTWNLQRQEDQIEADVRKEKAASVPNETQLKSAILERQRKEVGDIPAPPRFVGPDFKKPTSWRLRGKLDVPKERWIIYPGAERTTDTSLVIAWAGWNHKQQAQALAGYYQDRKDQDGWSKERLAPLIAGLKDLLPWLKQWHNDIDPQFQLRLGDFYEEFVRDQIHELGMNEAQIEELRIGPP